MVLWRSTLRQVMSLSCHCKEIPQKIASHSFQHPHLFQRRSCDCVTKVRVVPTRKRSQTPQTTRECDFSGVSRRGKLLLRIKSSDDPWSPKGKLFNVCVWGQSGQMVSPSRPERAAVIESAGRVVYSRSKAQ